MKTCLNANTHRVSRWTATGVLGLLTILLGAGGCSSELAPCNPPVPPGSRYKVTILGETPTSEGCHIAVLDKTFEVRAADADPSAGTERCALTPARWAPAQRGLTVVNCEPSSSHMLGTNCLMRYPSTCEGRVAFYFYAQPGQTVDWSAPVITNAVFRVEDTTMGCIPDRSDCLDEYNVILERMPPLEASGG